MNNSIILKKSFEQYLLSLGGRKVPTPYRINIPFQPDRKLYGKSSGGKLTKDTRLIALEKGFNLQNKSVEDIKEFMQQQKLGIDCSGFAYQLLDNLLKKTGQGSMIKNGFPKASSTNVEKLTSSEFSNKIKGWDQVMPGDLIKLNSQKKIPHILIVLEVEDKTITYAHSSTKKGVHQDQITNGNFPKELLKSQYNEKSGDGIYRLKILS